MALEKMIDIYMDGETGTALFKSNTNPIFNMEQEEKIKKAIFEATALGVAKIVRHYGGFIILAQNEVDYNAKVKAIKRGDRDGFLTVDRAASGRINNRAPK